MYFIRAYIVLTNTDNTGENNVLLGGYTTPPRVSFVATTTIPTKTL